MSTRPGDLALLEPGVPARARNMKRVWAQIRRRPSAVAGVTILLFFALVGLLAPLIAPHGTHEIVGEPFTPPSSSHPLGLDDGGVDMLSLLMHGARASMLVGLAAALVASIVGGLIGLTAGFLGGRSDQLLMGITDYFLVIPVIPLMIVVATVWGPSLSHVILIIGLVLWTTTARLVRAQAKTTRERGYVRRAEALGASRNRVMFGHVLPQVMPLLVATSILTVGVAIFAETAVAFLGLGDPSVISWGRLINNAFQRAAVASGAWWAIVPPGVCVALVVVGCSLVGRGIEDLFNPRLGVAHLSNRRYRVLPPGGSP